MATPSFFRWGTRDSKCSMTQARSPSAESGSLIWLPDQPFPPSLIWKPVEEIKLNQTFPHLSGSSQPLSWGGKWLQGLPILCVNSPQPCQFSKQLKFTFSPAAYRLIKVISAKASIAWKIGRLHSVLLFRGPKANRDCKLKCLQVLGRWDEWVKWTWGGELWPFGDVGPI